MPLGSTNRAYRFLAALLLAFWALVPGACTPEPPTPEPEKASLGGAPVRLLIVGERPLATAAARLQGEWHAQSGAEIEISQMTEEQFSEAEQLACDAVIAPSQQLGPAVQRGLAKRLSTKALRDSAGDWTDVFELARLHDTSWGPHVHGISFGTPLLVCYCRADLLARLGREPPQSWPEYLELARLLGEHARPGASSPETGDGWAGAAEPLGPGWAGLVLLARAACYAKHWENYSTLFRISDFEPLIDGPPFVRALEELVAASRLGPRSALRSTPADVRAAFWQGKCGMALTWPTAAEPMPGEPQPQVEVLFAELPGSRDAYNVETRQWQRRPEGDEGRVPLLGLAGLVGMVHAHGDRQEASLQLLGWLSAAQPEHPLPAATAASTLFRGSHAAAPQAWTEGRVPHAAAAQYAALVKQMQRRQEWMWAPRIPGRQQYLAALDQAVRAAIEGASAAEALGETARQWREISARLDVKRQRAAYLRSLEREP